MLAPSNINVVTGCCAEVTGAIRSERIMMSEATYRRSDLLHHYWSGDT
jgi:hypothetical protein